ncbi:MAG: Ig-like domain-containing protein [Bacteroidales bacterium]|nr:Ig-like domain-containing protein [Bacteroidales bacterium]
MKKINAIIFSALALIAAASCNKEVDVQDNPTKGKAVVLTAKLEGTKTSLDGVNIVWSRNDFITAFNIDGENILSTQTEVNEDGSEAQFTVVSGSDLMYAICPANTFATMDDNGTITTEIPTTQAAVAGSFADGANLAIANINDVNNLRFKNVGGLLAFKVKASTHNIVSATISGNVAGEVGGMTGAINVSIDSQDNVSSICSGPCSVTVDGTIEVGQTYYAVVAPGTYSNVTIVFTDDQGNTATYTKSADLVVERNSNQLIGGFSPDSRWQENEKYYVKVTSDDDIVAGSYLIVYETLDNDANDVAEVFAGVDLDTNLGTVASDIPVITENGVKKIALSEGGRYNVVVEELNGGYSIGWDTGYLAYNRPAGTEKYNNLYLVASPGVESQWILSVVDGIQNAYNTERYLQYNTGSPRFACYTGSQQDVSLYLLEGTGHSSGKQNVSLSFNPATVELTFGDEFTAPVLTTDPTGLEVTYSSSNTAVATVDAEGVVSVVGAGEATITAAFAGDDNYKAGSAYYTITVNPVIDYIFYESFDQCKGVGGGTGEDLNGTGSTNIIPDNENWDFTRGNGANKCAKFGSGSAAGSATTPALGIPEGTSTATLTFKAGAWKGDTGLTLNISIVGNGQASVKSITLLNNQFSEYTVIMGNGIDANTKVNFSAAEANKNRFFLDEVKVVAGGEMPFVKADPTLSFNPTSKEVTIGESFTAPVLTTDPEGLEVTYSSSNTNVATVDASTGAVTLVAAGTTTITATFAGNDLYYEGSASYILTVNSNVDNGDGSLENPFNVAGAYAYIDSNGSENVYVTGIISSIGTNGSYSEGYGNATFFISDDGTTDSPQFEAFRVMFLNNRKWKEGNTQIAVGDEVILYGKLTKYNDIYETKQNEAYLYSLNGNSTILESPVFSTETDDLDIIVSWNAVSGATGYEIKCGDLSYTAGASETSFTLSMDDYGTYAVRIIAKGTNVEPGVSDPKEVTLIDPSLTFTDVPSQSYTFSSMGYTNQQEVSTIANTQNCTIVFAKGTNSNGPKYYTSGAAVRAYGGNTITVTPAEGYQITKIRITFGSGDGSNVISTDVGSFVNETWTGAAKATPIVFTIGGTSGNRRISAIAINPVN